MTASAVAGPIGPTNLWTRALLWLGVPLCMLGIAGTDLWRQLLPEHSREVLQLALVASVAAWIARRLLACPMATGLLLAWGAALVVFAGPVAVAATVLLGGAAIAGGGVLARAGSPALQCACGLALLAGVGGWPPPLPGARWIALLRRENISDVIAEDGKLSVAQRRMLEATGATGRGRVGALSWWQLPAARVRR